MQLPSGVSLAQCSRADFEALAALRLQAMQESMERLGRFDPHRSRDRLRRSFYPEYTRFIVQDGQRIGFYTLRPAPDGFHLEHFYVLPGHQSQGIGQALMAAMTAQADAAQLPIFLGALKRSRSNAFYERHGFAVDVEGEWDLFYVRRPRPAGA